MTGTLGRSSGSDPRDPGDADVLERLARVAVSRLVEPGRRALAARIAAEGAAGLLDRALSGDDERVAATLRARLGTVDPWARARDDLDRAARIGARALIPTDPEWPHPSVDELDPLATSLGIDVAPPLCLWVRGRAWLGAVCGRAVSLVGARAATAYGTHVAAELAYGLADRGWTVISGGAYGIDAAAHRGALGAGGLTVAVLPCGIDMAYPLGHAALFDRIAEEGLLVSECPPGEAPQRHRFLLRNRLIAALAKGVVVVEAGTRSGTAVTAERAHQLGRVLMAVPGPVTSRMSRGTHQLVRDCAATLVTSAAEVIEEVGEMGEGLDLAADAEVEVRDPGRSALTAELVRVLEAVPAGRPATVEDIASAARTTPTAARRALPLLAVGGFVEDRGGGYRLALAGRRHRDGAPEAGRRAT